MESFDTKATEAKHFLHHNQSNVFGTNEQSVRLTLFGVGREDPICGILCLQGRKCKFQLALLALVDVHLVVVILSNENEKKKDQEKSQIEPCKLIRRV